MPIRFKCSTSGKNLSVKDGLAGKKIKCPVCGNIHVVPVAQSEPENANSSAPKPATIEIRRISRFAAALRNFTVWIDEEETGTLSSGEVDKFNVQPGFHVVEVTIDGNSSPAFEITLQQGELAVFECEVQMGFFTSSVDLRCIHRPLGTDAVRQVDLSENAGYVLAAGFASFCVGLFGLYAIVQGATDLRKMSRGEMEKRGRARLVFGMILGAAGFLFNVIGMWLLFFGKWFK